MAERSLITKCRIYTQVHLVPMFAVTLCAALLALWPVAAQAQTAIAHWSFDTPTLTISGGNITAVDDVVGSHDAFVSSTGVRAAPASAPIVAARDSASGQFGQGFRFNGDTYMLYPDLAELMQTAGGSNYSVSMWVKWLNPTAPVGNSVFRTMSNWGNAAPGVGGTNSSHVYGFGPNGAATIRAQTRAELVGDNDGVDIFARNSAGTVTGGLWHMLTWTFDINSGVLTSYFDGVQTDTFTSAAASKIMADGLSPNGAFGLKGDDAITAQPIQSADVFLDEVWVFSSVLTADQVVTLRDQNGFGPPPVPGDTDGDGIVELEDFNPIRDNFRKSVSSRTQGDLVRNNFVDFNDFREWKAAFLGLGGSLAGVDLAFLSNVPEPSAGLSLLLGILSSAGIRKKRLPER